MARQIEGIQKTVNQDVIELNGKRYDARTGALLGESMTKPIPAAQPASGRVIDGFIRRSRLPQLPQAQVIQPKTPKANHAPTNKTKTAAQKTPKPAESAQKTRTHHTPEHVPRHTRPIPVAAHRPEHAKTLMRRGVHKPEFSLKPAIKPQAPAEMTAKPKSALMHKHSASHVDLSRLERASHINRHSSVEHFRPPHREPEARSVASHVPHIAVRSAPEHVSGMRSPAYTSHAHRTHSDKSVNQNGQAHTNIFEAAIARATSHEQPRHTKPYRRRKRLINSLAIVAAFLVIGGFIGYLNLPTIQLRVASVQTGFRVSMPSYTPTGYALEDGVKRSGGTVSMSFRSGENRYTITQQASNWNSQTLLDNTLALNGSHKTVQKNGQTIYIYDNNADATWVNGGVRYDIVSNTNLGIDEITAIATSL